MSATRAEARFQRGAGSESQSSGLREPALTERERDTTVPQARSCSAKGDAAALGYWVGEYYIGRLSDGRMAQFISQREYLEYMEAQQLWPE